MRGLLALPLSALLLLAAAAAAPRPAAARRLQQAAGGDGGGGRPPVLRVGMSSAHIYPLVDSTNGSYRGFEPMLVEALAKQAGFTPEIVPLKDYDARFTALLNDTAGVDMVVYAFTVTEERSSLIDFLYPSYYSSGVALFTPDGELEGVDSWADMANRTVAVDKSHYILRAAPSTPSLKGVRFVEVANAQEGARLIAAGGADAYATDSAFFVQSYPGGNLTAVSHVEPILRAPYSVAIAKGRPGLNDQLSQALVALATGNDSAPLLEIERQTFIAAGGQPNPDLADLVRDPAPGASTLYPPPERQCGPVFTDSIGLPSDYTAVATWNVTGVQNWTCADGKKYTYLGWLANATDAQTGQHAGYSYTAPGLAGTHVPFFVATSPDNQTVSGTLINVREAGGVDMPSPVAPDTNTFWYRRPAYEQTGTFAEPLVLYLTKTNTTGGTLPPGVGACKEGDPMIVSPVNALFTFYACAG